MGPERNAPENWRNEMNLLRFTLSFNGAGAECSGKLPVVMSREGVHNGFNGAGAECSGKPLLDSYFDLIITLLQWGRSGMLRKT